MHIKDPKNRKRRTLRVNILFIFLTLMICFFLGTTWYTYYSNKQVIIEFTQKLMKQVVQNVTLQLNNMIGANIQLAKIEESVLPNNKSINVNNKSLMDYMRRAIRAVPGVSFIHAAGSQGSWMGAMTLLPGEHYRGDSSKMLPETAFYAIQVIDREVENPHEQWIYLNKDGEEVAKETIETPTFNPLTRPWYIGAIQSKKPYWTDIYEFIITKTPGISLAYPLFNEKGEIYAVTGSDIELIFISQFLHEQLDEAEELMILNEDGRVIATSSYKEKAKILENDEKLVPVAQINPVVGEAFEQYKLSKQNVFLFRAKNEQQYLTSFTPYNSPSGKTWLVVVQIPSKVFLEGLYNTQDKVYKISLLLLLIAIFFITLFATKISRPIVQLADVVNSIRQFDLSKTVETDTSIKEIYLVQHAVAAMRSALISFSKYLPQEVVKNLLRQGKEIELGGQRKELTILFTDIANFTTIAEKLSTDKLTEQITEYLEPLSEIIIQNQGTIDKYIGDSIMAIWGAPVDVPDHVYLACHSALQGQKVINELNEHFISENKDPLLTRMGIHTGTVLVGNVGTQKRMNYTVIGDAVNLAARLEGINKNYQTSICISEETYNRVKDKFLARPLDIVAVKGKKNEVKIYELMAEFQDPHLKPSESQLDLHQKFSEAFNLYQTGDKQKACKLFHSIQEKYPQDAPTALYVERCNQKSTS